MNRDDIIRMAREAGAKPGIENVADEAFLERFYALAVAKEREACALVAEDWQTAIHDPRYECDCATAIRARSQP